VAIIAQLTLALGEKTNRHRTVTCHEEVDGPSVQIPSLCLPGRFATKCETVVRRDTMEVLITGGIQCLVSGTLLK